MSLHYCLIFFVESDIHFDGAYEMCKAPSFTGSLCVCMCVWHLNSLNCANIHLRDYRTVQPKLNLHSHTVLIYIHSVGLATHLSHMPVADLIDTMEVILLDYSKLRSISNNIYIDKN